MRSLLNATLGVICISAGGLSFPADLGGQFARYRVAHETQIVAQLDRLTRIRSVDLWLQGLRDGVQTCAARMAELTW